MANHQLESLCQDIEIDDLPLADEPIKKIKKNPERININDPYLINDLAGTDYGEGKHCDIGRLLSDLQKLLVYTISPQIYYLKSKPLDEIMILVKSLKEITSILKDITIYEYFEQIQIGKNSWKQVKHKKTLNDVFNDGGGPSQHKQLFRVRSVKFLSDDPRDFSIFRGYPHTPPEEIDFDIINPFLRHVEEVIADGDGKLYDYILNWISFIVQNPGKKNTTALVIVGDKGTGKGDFFAIPISKLFGGYALQNITSIETITGRFNGSVEGKVLGVCNEMQSVENAKYMNSDSLKSIITEYQLMYENKFVNQRQGENVINLMFLSNHALPIKIENADRRYVCTTVSNKYRQNFHYFGKLASVLDFPDFISNLYAFFLYRDIRKYQPRLIPVTETKTEMINASKESWELFGRKTWNYSTVMELSLQHA
jgi:hypothetical protein